MAIVIKSKKEEFTRENISQKSDAFEFVKRFFPYRLNTELYRLAQDEKHVGKHIEEIRIRSESAVYVTLGGGGGKTNVPLECVLSKNEIAQVLEKMCDGSLYAYKESIVSGYVSLDKGIRVGVCGRASVDGGRILGVYNVSSLNIRLPCGTVEVDKKLVETVTNAVLRSEGVLIYSPPSQGKTTLLRSLAKELSGGACPLRVILVDTREEIGNYARGGTLSLDVLSGYPKAEGIRIATAFMNPQVIICDEIGAEDEAIAIAQAQNSGVPLIASAHGSCAEGIMKRGGMRFLHDVGAFSLYIGIRISANGGFEYRIQRAEEIEVENIRNSDIVV